MKKIVAWNKGLRTSKVLKKYGSWCKYLRLNKEYRLKELQKNAMREPKYRSKEKFERDLLNLKNRVDICGIFPQRFWDDDEVEFLQKNYKKKSITELALNLGRSLHSISRKMNRMRFLKNNKWR